MGLFISVWPGPKVPLFLAILFLRMFLTICAVPKNDVFGTKRNPLYNTLTDASEYNETHTFFAPASCNAFSSSAFENPFVFFPTREPFEIHQRMQSYRPYGKELLLTVRDSMQGRNIGMGAGNGSERYFSANFSYCE